jgi:hypothetical protein
MTTLTTEETGAAQATATGNAPNATKKARAGARSALPPISQAEMSVYSKHCEGVQERNSKSGGVLPSPPPEFPELHLCVGCCVCTTDPQTRPGAVPGANGRASRCECWPTMKP